MKLKERILMGVLGFTLAIALVLLFESAHEVDLKSVAAAGGNARHGVIRTFQQRNLQKMASNR